MATTGSITLQQLFRHPYVLKLISRIKSSGNPLQTFYGLGLDNSATESVPAGVRTFSYDIFDHTRQLATVRPSKVGPYRGRVKGTSTRTGHLLRSHDSLAIAWEDIVNTRPHGAPIGRLDRTGQNKVTMQIKHMTERYRNLREWMVSRMFRGGYSIKFTGDRHYLAETGAGDRNISYDFPSAHTDQLAVGDSAADIITTSWDDPTADIMGQFLRLNKAAERITGYVIKHVWINSTTLSYLMNNTSLQEKGGTAFRVWENVNAANIKTADGSRESGKIVTFRAMPWITFHVYDGVLLPGSSTADTFPETSSTVDLVIPNNKAIFTPEPSSEWLGFAEGAEPVVKTLNSPMEIVKGFATWGRPMLEPAGQELLFLDNFCPVPYNSYAWFYPTVVF